MKNILAEADISDNIPQEFAIYDLPEFLNLASGEVFLGAEYSFNEQSVLVTKGGAKSRYFYVKNPNYMVNIDDETVEIKFHEGTNDNVATN